MSTGTTLFVTATPNPTQQVAMQAYLQGVMPLLTGAGGRLVKRLKVNTSLAGTPPFQMALVMDFDDRSVVEAMFASDAYAKLIPARKLGFSVMNICLTDTL